MLSSYEKRVIGRYLWPGSEGRIIVLIAGIGLGAVAIGVAALIVVMSVMNGARTKLTIQFAGIDGHASISRTGGQLADWRAIEKEARRHSAVLSTVPIVDAPVMASLQDRILPANVRGIRPRDARLDQMFAGPDAFFVGVSPANDEEVAVGSQLAAMLGASIGSRIMIMRPALDAQGALSVKSVGYRVTGLIQTGIAQHDSALVVMNMGSAQTLLGRGDVVSKVNLTTRSAERTGELLTPLIRRLNGVAMVKTWREMNKPIFDALAFEQIGMFIALSIIVLVALFNILSSLVLLVRSKVRDIAIMRTMGASRNSIIKIFVAVGTAIGSLGTALGGAIGFSLVALKEDLADLLKNHVLGGSYTKEVAALIDLPAQISLSEGAGIMTMALTGTILATLYPAFKAAAVDPASVLRYD